MTRFFDALQRSQAERSGVDVSALPGATEAKEGGEQEAAAEWETALKGHGKNIAQVYSEYIGPPDATEPPGAPSGAAPELHESVEQEAALQQEAAPGRLGKNPPQVDSGINGPPRVIEPNVTELKQSVDQEAASEPKTALRRLVKKAAQVDPGVNEPPHVNELKQSAEQEAALQWETALGRLRNKTARADSANTDSGNANAANAVPGKNEPLSASVLPAAEVRTTPAITWPTPELITYGNKLTSTQLNATASVEGTFLYSPEPDHVLPAGAHTLRVTFTPADSGGHAPRQAAVSIVVAKATPALSWPTPRGIIYGSALSNAQLNASASVPGKFEYSPAPGEVLPPGTHTLSVTFTPADKANCAAAHASVSLTVARATSVIQWPTPNPIPYGAQLSAAELCAVASVPGTFAYDPASGAVLAVGEHKLSVVFTPEDTSGYSPSQTAATLTVTPAASVIQWPTPSPIPYGTHLSAAQLCAVASVPGTFAYEPASGAVLAVGEHKLSAVFTPENTSGYAPSQISASLTVAKATSVVTWPTPGPISYGAPLSSTQLCAVASVPGTFEYDPASGAVLTAGEHNLSAVFTPEDTFGHSPSQTAASLTVAKATPAITWPAPGPIAHGAPIAAAHLNASAKVPGAFVYTPAAGEILDPGLLELSVTFTPTDNLNYTTARAVVPLTITRKLAAATLKHEADAALFQSFSPKKVKVEAERKPAKKKWAIVAAVGVCLILLALIFLVPLFLHGTRSEAKPSIPPSPEVSDTQPATNTTNTPNPPITSDPAARVPSTQNTPPATTSKQPATDNQPAEQPANPPANHDQGVTPAQTPTQTQTQTKAMNDQLTAPTRIPRQQAENSPPPAGSDTAGVDGLGGGNANASIFNGHAQPTVRVTSSRPVVVSFGVAKGMLLQSPPPVYPPLAKTAHVSGTVELHATIATNGTIKDLHAVNGPVMLRQAAIDAVRNWRYKPYKLNDQPVEVETTINVVFTLGG
jgi:TonB family protein